MAQSHFLSLKDWSREEIELLFELSAAIKSNPEGYTTALAGKSLGMIFQKPSTRTRVSFEVGMFQLGGQAALPGLERHPAPPRGDDRRHRAGALPLRARDHGPRVRPPGHPRPRAPRLGARHQRAQRPAPPLPGARRLLHPARAAGRPHRPAAGLRGRRQQRRARADVRRGQARDAVRDRLPPRLRAEPAHLQERGARGAEAGLSPARGDQRPARGGGRRRRRLHGRLDLDGAGGRVEEEARRLPGLPGRRRS